ncbi:metal ABC transporter permease [Jongsikchunia kroppenstedtii]|uniref:metal ABC transporter permease n=1 Tax=Jongsikchunia kroppenstedtii TaxID=1121721 RepID=UPI00036852CD|nr:metal ABC transporter permease [Jongsikchunia kroppenstedtii]
MDMFDHAFVVHALVAGSVIAVLCGLVGYLLLQRGEIFAGDALGHVAYTGAMAALALGVAAQLGLYVAVVVAGAILALTTFRPGATTGGQSDDADTVIGAFFAWMMGLGALLLTVYTTHRSAAHGNANVSVLFGSIFGISATAVLYAVVISGIAVAAVLVIARPLLFSTIDPAVARARGVPVVVLAVVFLALTGIAVAEGSQLVGSIVVLGLLSAPAASAARITAHPWRAIALSAALAVVSVWGGVIAAYQFPKAPVSFTIMTVAVSIYVVTLVAGRSAAAFRRAPRGAGA